MLDGIRVVILGSGTPISTFAAVLGDQGADVIRVEPPGAGDPGRRRGPMVDGGSLEWAVAGRSCRGVTCDPATTEGRDLLVRLLATADVVGEALGPHGLEDLALAPGELRGPRVVLRFTGRGIAAADADLPAPELIALATGGMLTLTGQPDRPPVALGVRYAEQFAGVSGATAALAALLEPPLPEAPEDATPEIVDIATRSAVLRVTEWTVPAYDRLGTQRTREGNRPSSVAPLDVYLSADDEHVAIVGGSDANFARLVRAIDRPELGTDPKYATTAARIEHSTEINEIVADWVRSSPADEIGRRCATSGTPVGRVAHVADLLDDAHFAARGDFVVVDDPVVGRHRQQAPHPRFDGERVDAVRPAPAVGQHNLDVWCTELGVAAEDLARFEELGVV